MQQDIDINFSFELYKKDSVLHLVSYLENNNENTISEKDKPELLDVDESMQKTSDAVPLTIQNKIYDIVVKPEDIAIVLKDGDASEYIDEDGNYTIEN